MKKLVSIILVIFMILSAGMLSVFAGEIESDISWYSTMYKDVFEKEYGESMYYDVLYIYPQDLEEYYLEWMLVEAVTEKTIVETSPDVDTTRCYVNGEFAFHEKDLIKPFNTPYFVFDVWYGEFIDITVVDIDKYAGLRDTILKNRIAPLIGDLNSDRVVSILDVTELQCIEAKLSEAHTCNCVADFDRDGERSVLDATAIQLKLAGLSE